MTDKLIIFDTTLRDGEQSPGASMTKVEKLRIARQLERLKVDVIEAGFAASSTGDFECVQALTAQATATADCASSGTDSGAQPAARARFRPESTACMAAAEVSLSAPTPKKAGDSPRRSSM